MGCQRQFDLREPGDKAGALFPREPIPADSAARVAWTIEREKLKSVVRYDSVSNLRPLRMNNERDSISSRFRIDLIFPMD